MLAIIKLAGAQHLVKKDDVIKVNKLDFEVGSEFTITDILSIIDNNKVKLEADSLGKISIKAKVLEQGRDKKVIIFKKKRRKHHKRKNGHRQYITKVQILDIS